MGMHREIVIRTATTPIMVDDYLALTYAGCHSHHFTCITSFSLE